MALPFSEWSREEKDEFAKKRMDEMKYKNEQLRQRYAEVEQDRIRAEAKNSAITSSKPSKKEHVVFERERIVDVSRVAKEREWDKGKQNQDSDDWSPPRFPGHRSRAQRRSCSDRKTPKKEENWRVRSTNLSKDRQSYFQKSRPSGPNHKYQDSSFQGTSGFRSDVSNAPRPRGRGHRASSGTYKSFQTSKLDEPRKKCLSGEAGSRSPSLSEPEIAPITYQIKAENDRMWLDEGVTEVQNKQSRVEKWVKSINLAGNWDDDYNLNKSNEYFGGDYSKKVHTSRGGHAPVKNVRYRYEDSKYGQVSRGNYRSRGSRILADERRNVGFDNKYERGGMRGKDFGDKNRLRRESDLSDRTSSMKESDYHDYAMDKFNKASDSRSSDRSGVWEGEDSKDKHASETKSFEKQFNIRSYGKDKYNKLKSLRSTGVSGCQEAMRKSDIDNEYAENIRQKYPNSYAKDKLKSKNPRKSDSYGFDDQAVGNRPGFRKPDNYSGGTNKFNKWKPDSKFIGHSERFEDNYAADNNARSSRKNKYGKPSPKRTPSNTVKSVETSSSASKTIEVNSAEDDMWGDCDKFGVPWNIDLNESGQVEFQNVLKNTGQQNDDPSKDSCAQNDVLEELDEQNVSEKEFGTQNDVPEELGDQNIPEVPGEHDVSEKEFGAQNHVPEESGKRDVSIEEPDEHELSEELGRHDVMEEPDVSDEEPGEPDISDEEPGEPGISDEEPSEPGVSDDEPGVSDEEPVVSGEEPGEHAVSGEEFGEHAVSEVLCEQNYVLDESEQNYVLDESEQNYVLDESEQNYVLDESEQNYVFDESEQNYVLDESEQNYVLDESEQNYFPEKELVEQNVSEVDTGEESGVPEKGTAKQNDSPERETECKYVYPIVFSPPRKVNWAEESELYFQSLEAQRELELNNSEDVISDKELYNNDYISVIESREGDFESSHLSIVLADTKIDECDAVDATENKDASFQADSIENKLLSNHENSNIVPETLDCVSDLPHAKTDLSYSLKTASQVSEKMSENVKDDKGENLFNTYTYSSSQNVKDLSVDDSENALESSDIAIGELCSTTCGNKVDQKNKGALSLSDGGLSSVSEGKNSNKSGKGKNKRKRKSGGSKK
ncbi:uncharacterized protein NPIL_386831 [Nephila pilipes]|uniref:Uncharacterized protein n=1 Tax=Nephila pilipes TaxID=299642 RepID=A0A8X6U9L1_NEPPI|nr:uncharacterized protein NPIL_386831 [Nephila pilipes]